MNVDREDRTEQPTAPTDSPPAAPRRPSPKPPTATVTPTSRARRAAAAGVQPALRRPSPQPDGTADRAERDPVADRVSGKPTATESLVADRPAVEPGVGPDQAPAKTLVEHRVRTRSPLWLASVLIVVIAMLAGLSGWLAFSSTSSGSVSQRDQALSAAKSSVPLILSYNYKSFDADLAKAQAQLTGRAKADYVKAMSSTIKPAAAKADVVVQAQTDSAGVESVSANGDQVTVVVFGEQRVTNTALSSPRIDPFRVRATLDRVAGHWLVSKFDQI
ncbi:MAG: hypothetical protein ABI140_09520 [Jatrophihabitantaceae bacterium]